MKICSIPCCNKPHEAKNLCHMHYTRLRFHGDINHVRKERGKCSLCDKPHYGHKFCKMHYERFIKYGDPHFKKYNDAGSGWIYDGYHMFEKDNIKYKTHRVVMEQHIKRPLTEDELVHHINGNKLDNRISNLKIMTRSEHSKLHKIEYWKLKKNN